MGKFSNRKCDLDCPWEKATNGITWCCNNCKTQQGKRWLEKHPEYEEYFDLGKYGFWTPKGCVLKRKDMPTECKEYDCKDHIWFVVWAYKDGRWQALRLNWSDMERRYFQEKWDRAFGNGIIVEK